MPMLPAAPPRLSTITCWPSECEMAIERMRAMMSVGPPGAKGTTRVMGRSGYAASVGATRHAKMPAQAAAKALRRMFSLTLPTMPFSLSRPNLLFFVRLTLLPFNQLAGAGAHVGRRIDGRLCDLLRLLAGHRADVGFRFLRLGQKISIHHRGIEGAPHRFDPLGRNARAGDQRARDRRVGGDEREHLPVGVVLGEILERRDIRQ